ncbi:MAG: alpha/beta hydrolase [Chloroflexota bacterium]
MRETIVQSGDAQLWTVSEGDGLPILLCNGGPGLPDYLGDVAAMIRDRVQVIRWEQRGCGRSTGSGPYTIEQTLDDIEAIRKHYGFERWLVGGHSWGADLSLIYAVEYAERVLGGMCIAGGRMNNDREWHTAYKQGKEKGELLPKFDFPPNDIVNKHLNDDRKRYIQEPFLLQDLANLDIPVVFIYGSADIRPSWAVEQIAYLLPNGDYREISGAGHAIWMTHHFALRSAMREFIRQFTTASV